MNGPILAALFLSAPARLPAEPVDLYRFEVPAAIPAPQQSCLKIGPSSPDGPVWGSTDRYLVKDGIPFMPVMAEFHFSRCPAEEWEEELEKIKAGGVDVITTYLFWIHHEEEEGVFDFSGQRDLRRFIELCGRHGLYVWLRIGPWCHGEVRNGGFPDWLRKPFGVEENGHLGWRGSPRLRSNDPEYLELVDRLYAAYGKQCKGLLAKDGGPIIGVQVENEYSKVGEGKGEEHISKLIELAGKNGFDVPFFSVTGWHNAPFPARGCLPMFNGYPAAPWAIDTQKLTPRRVYRFDLQRRSDGIHFPETDTRRDLSPYPLLFCEIAVGNETTDHRRPQVGALDGVVVAFTRLGVGAAGLGYYMYHGGTNPDGKFATLQESKATGYPNDCPVKSYDFQAAIRESGRIDEKYHHLRMLHYFMRDFGEQLAPTIALLPDRAPESNDDFGPVRMALRTDGETGFLFVNNHVRGYPQPDRRNVQVAVKLADREIRVPREPVDIPSSAFFVWPVNLDMEGARLLYSTAQPLCVLEHEDGKTYIFSQTITEKPEYLFDADTIKGGKSCFEVEPGTRTMLHIETTSGKMVGILTLTAEQALQTYKMKSGGRDIFHVREPVQIDKIPEPEVSSIGKHKWDIDIGALPEHALLRIHYTGDVAELYLGDRLIYDNYYNGEVFEVSLDRFADELKTKPLTLKITPLDESKKIYLDVPRPKGDPVLESVELEIENRIPLTVQ